MKKPYKVVITTGDVDGIGTEITSKALAKLKPIKDVHFIIWRSPQCPKKHLRTIDSQFDRVTVSSWPEALRVVQNSHNEIIDISSNLGPAKWVELTAKGSMFGHVDAITTAPLSKLEIVRSGYNLIGHTEILKSVSKSSHPFMAFVGKEFNLLLSTGHLPISKVSETLDLNLLLESIYAANRLRKLLTGGKRNRSLALVGINPHAGEDGLIGNEELDIFLEAIKIAKSKKIPIEGPLVPDAAFLKENWSKYSVYLCPYHDQGLIPFKLVHGHKSGVHITMGLPFIRTSVEHGTAKKLFGKNKAYYESMLEAIKWSIDLAKQNRIKNSILG